MFYRLGQRRLFYSLTKQPRSGRLLILVHGLGTDHNYHLLKFLAARFRLRASVLTFDLAGYGSSSGGLQVRRVRTFVKDLDQLVNWAAKQLPEKEIILIGHSLGALISLLEAARNPLVSGVVAIGSNAEGYRLYRDYLKRGLIKVYKHYSSLRRHRLAKDFWTDRLHFQPLQLVPRIKCPVLYIYGSQDRTNPVGEGRKLYLRTRSSKRLAIIKGADHHFRRPRYRQQVYQVIKKWLKL